MARRLNAFVRKEACAKVGKEIGIGEALKLISPAEDRQGGRAKLSIVGDAVEALMAALYLDGGWPAAKDFYERYWKVQIAEAPKDPKTELQERAAVDHRIPEYARAGADGAGSPADLRGGCHRQGQSARRKGTGSSKKDAERFAARHLLDEWT